MHEQASEIKVLSGYSDISASYQNVELDNNKENVVVLDALEINKDNTINSLIDVGTETYQNYYNWISQNNISIIGNFKNNTKVSTNFTTYEQRNAIIKELYNKVMQNQYKGICIDFEDIDDVNSFYRFLIELTPKFKESGLKVIVKMNSQLDKKRVENIVDFII